MVKKTYIVTKALLTIQQVEIIKKKKFKVAAIDADIEIFVVYIVALAEPIIMPIYPSYKV